MLRWNAHIDMQRNILHGLANNTGCLILPDLKYKLSSLAKQVKRFKLFRLVCRKENLMHD